MKKDDEKNSKTYSHQRRTIESAFESITSRKSSPVYVYVILLLLYLVCMVAVSISSHNAGTINFCGYPIEISSFRGVFSALSTICVILMTVYCGKAGYFTALFVELIQFPMILISVIRQKNLNGLPGLFGGILAILAVTLIYVNDKKLKKANSKLNDQLITDNLTGLPNRFAFSALIKDMINREQPFAFVWINLDHFKSVNDSVGFDVGNDILREIASRWKNVSRSGISGTNDIMTRIGGDEFGLIICGHRNDDDIVNTIRHYETALHNRLTVDGCDFYINASFGYVEFPADGKTSDEIGSFANAAMQEVKRTNSSDRIVRFTPDLLHTERTLEIESKIRAALDNDTIYFNLQPQYDMSHKLRGFESLARMKDADGTLINPAEFIPVSEKVGLVDKVDAAVFRKSAEFFGELIRKYELDITLSVNVSVRHLMKSNFLEELKKTLAETGVPADRVEIEITESIMIDSVDKALQTIDEISKLGVKIAIDDFGTGYSSLSYLNKFPANLLKVDKSFIDKMNTSESSRQYVAAIISMGHIMGFDVISEGVETEEQLNSLKDIGCDYIQGFFWGRPMSAEDAEKIVAGCVSR